MSQQPADPSWPRSEEAPRATPGTYALILRCRRATRVEVGRLGSVALAPGHYLYVGSAFGPGGVRARVARHCRADKRRYWHLDYLAAHAEPVTLWYSHAPERLEHAWAAALGAVPGLAAVPGFGASDCRCRSHLFAGADAPALALLPPALRRGAREIPLVGRGAERRR